jgi:hypothetical protein
MTDGKYELRMVKSNPDLYTMFWVPKDGPPVQQDVDMTEPEARSSLEMKYSRSQAEIDQVIQEAQEKFVA